MYLKMNQTLAGLTDDGIRVNQNYINGLLDLFQDGDKAYVFNDIDPENNTGKIISMESYVTNVRTWYRSGLEVKIDIEEGSFAEPVKAGDSELNYVSIVYRLPRLLPLGNRNLDGGMMRISGSAGNMGQG